MRSFLTFLFISLAAQSSQAEIKCLFRTYEVGNIKTFRGFVAKLKKANTAKKMEKLMHYPANLNLKGKKLKIKNKNDFFKHYKDIMSEKIKNTIKTNDPYDTFCNYDGLSLGKGSLWVQFINSKYKIIAFNP